MTASTVGDGGALCVSPTCSHLRGYSCCCSDSVRFLCSVTSGHLHAVTFALFLPSHFSPSLPPLPSAAHSFWTAPDLSGLAAPYLSPVKALVAPMPKLLKSLLPARDGKKDLRLSLPSQQVGASPWPLHAGAVLHVTPQRFSMLLSLAPKLLKAGDDIAIVLYEGS